MTNGLAYPGNNSGRKMFRSADHRIKPKLVNASKATKAATFPKLRPGKQK